MPLVPPNLDTRTFEQILTEVRRRVPTYTPEWTDLNDGDPGITLAQLFAFMSEQLLFQVNQVPEKGLITFLKMVGAELHPATPAVADITFIPTGANNVGADPTFPLDARTQVQTSGPPPGQKTPITFETIRPFTVINGTIEDLVTSNATGAYPSVKASNDSKVGTYAPFGAAKTVEDAFFIVLDLNVKAGAPPWPMGTFRVRVDVAGSTDVGEPGEPDATGSAPRIAWSYSSGTTSVGGETMVTFSPMTPASDSTLELTRSGYLEFTFDNADVMKRVTASGVLPAAFQDRFVLRAQVIRPGGYGTQPPVLKSVRLNTVTARCLTTVRDEDLGSSTGLPFQRFRLANVPVFPMSTSISVEEVGLTPVPWKETLDLFAAGPDDRVYQVIPATGEILFGDGVHGKIPPPDDGSDATGNVKAVEYQYGGGLGGNVGAGKLTRVLASPGPPSYDATNFLPARGGDDEEPVSLGVARAPAVIRSRYRAVSGADFEALARETPETHIARAHALPNTRPGVRPGRSPGSVTLILVPNALYQDTIGGPIPLLPETADAVRRYLDQRRLVTSEVFTAAARFRAVTVDVTLQLAPGASLTATKAGALDALNRYFHALVGGDDGLGWPFGGAIYFSRVFQQLLAVGGVLRVEQLAIALDGAPGVSCADVSINPGELLFSSGHIVRMRVPT
jgi:hypothetical protein